MQRLIAFPLHLEASRYPRRTGGRTNPLGQWTPATHHRRRSDWLGYGCTRRGPPGNYLRPQWEEGCLVLRVKDGEDRQCVLDSPDDLADLIWDHVFRPRLAQNRGEKGYIPPE